MGKRKTNEQFKEEMKIKNPNIEVLGEYIGSNCYILVKNKICGHTWDTSKASYLLMGGGCPHCNRSQKKTTEGFKEELKLKNPDVEILEDYINAQTPILARDNRCGHKWYIIPDSLIKGHGCSNKECIKQRLKDKSAGRNGEINYNLWNSEMQIIEYRGSRDLDVQFKDGYVVKNRSYRDFKKGHIEYPYDKSVFGIGCFGEGMYKVKEGNEVNTIYIVWHGMLGRCFNENTKRKQPTYRDVTCCNEWLNFQTFAKWYDANYYFVDGQAMCLDKDILIKGNKIYSPETCVIAPKIINNLFVKNDARRGNLPIGVTEKEDKYGFIYRARCNNILINKCIHLGYYSTPEQAFEQYKYYKEFHIKEVADYYRDYIPNNLYDAMYNWKVEITD